MNQTRKPYSSSNGLSLFPFLAILLISNILCLTAVFAQSKWQVYEETTIDGKISGSIKNGHIFKTVSKNIYQLAEYVYLYKYAYSPEVMVLTDGNLYKLLIEDFDEPLICYKLNNSETKSGASESVIESYIVSDFDGFEQGNIYKLANGQVWEQVDAWIWIWIWVNPRVTIYKTRGVYKMKVEQIEHPIAVQRIR